MRHAESGPAMRSTGVEGEKALVRPAAALYSPAPGTTSATPGFPDARAYPSAMYVVACSCRVDIMRILGSSRRPATIPYICMPGIPNTTSTPSFASDFARASPPLILTMGHTSAQCPQPYRKATNTPHTLLRVRSSCCACLTLTHVNRLIIVLVPAIEACPPGRAAPAHLGVLAVFLTFAD